MHPSWTVSIKRERERETNSTDHVELDEQSVSCSPYLLPLQTPTYKALRLGKVQQCERKTSLWVALKVLLKYVSKMMFYRNRVRERIQPFWQPPFIWDRQERNNTGLLRREPRKVYGTARSRIC